MSISKFYIRRIVMINVCLLFLGACTRPQANPSPEIQLPTPTSTRPPVSAAIPTTETPATATPTPTTETTLSTTYPVISPNPVAATLIETHTLHMENQGASQLTLDATYIYWITNENPGTIFRYPLTGDGEIEPVISTQFEEGDLNVMTPVRSGEWLIFFDTPHFAQGRTWALRALNLRDGTEQILLEEEGDPASWPGPLFDADANGDWVVWTRTRHAEEKACTETVLALYNLRTGERRELERECAEDNHMWSIPRLSGDQLVVEQDLPDSKGYANNIYLYDLTTGERRALTDDGRSSMPHSSGEWIAWRAGYRYEHGKATRLYNWRTGEQFKVTHAERLYGRLSGRWLFWPPLHKPLYVYDLATRQLLHVTTPGENEFISSLALHGSTIAWSFDLDHEHSASHDTWLVWGTLQAPLTVPE